MNDSPTVHDPAELRRKRIEAGLDQIDLARLAGLHQTYISLLERGKKKNPTARTLKRIADALGCEPVDLMPKRGSRRPKVAGRPVAGASARRAA